jgi:hypothetical protein
MTHARTSRLPLLVFALAIAAAPWGAGTYALEIPAGEDWSISFDNSLQYSLGMRTQARDPNIGNSLLFSQGDYKFNQGDLVTNRIQDLVEFQAVRKRDLGFRASASLWYDFAYDDEAKTNPSNPAYASLNAYTSGKYTDYTKRFFIRGAELLDSFVFANTDIAGTPVYLKLGRLTQQWGNAFFFGFSNIAYSQHPVDFIKAFAQPGTEVKELFLPRTQIMVTTSLTPELSLSGQYFFEFRPNRYPEGATYFGFFDPLFNGPDGTGAIAALSGGTITKNDGMVLPGHKVTRDVSFYVHNDFGVKVGWSPSWAGADMGFYFRQFDEVDPWLALVNPSTGHLQDTFAQHARLAGFSIQKAFGPVSTALEASVRWDTALQTASLVPTDVGATGSLTNAIANTLIQLGSTPLWSTGVLIAEVSYTHLNEVTGHKELYLGVGGPNCFKSNNPAKGPGSWKDGCSTDDAVHAAVLFNPQWLQVFPGFDFELPMSVTSGLYGNAAYRAGSFYAQGSYIYSVGLRTIFRSRHTATLTYSGYHWRPGEVADNGLGVGQNAYAGFGGNGPVGVNDRGWVQLQLKTSF